MATKKIAAEAVENENVEAQAEEALQEAAAPVDPWEEKMTVYVPRKAKGDDQSWFIMVNDRPMYVPANGKMQELPKPIAMILQNAVEAEAEAEEYSSKVTQEAMNAKGYLQ